MKSTTYDLSLTRADWLFALAIGVFAAPLLGLPFGWFGPVFAPLAGILAALVRRDHLRQLTVRVQNSVQEWDVAVNGVTVSRLRDDHYAALRLYVLQDWRVYAEQGINFAAAAVRACGTAGVGFLGTVLAMLVYTAIDSPASIAAAIGHPWPVAAVAAVVHTYASIAALGAITAVGVLLMCGTSFGAVDMFGSRTNAMIRGQLGIATGGPLVLREARSARAGANAPGADPTHP